MVAIFFRHHALYKQHTPHTNTSDNEFILNGIYIYNAINNLLKTLMKIYSPFIVGNCGELCNFETNILKLGKKSCVS